mmetsp:Transcript_6279/g.9969  ORF Transcript_6279/g.9969 Transcript_6279/m.9969 type:complete len:275 (-) Transcript_6279:1791-2615(-)
MKNYQLTIEAEDVKRVSIRRRGSTYALVTISGTGPREGDVLGKTEVLEDFADPRWSTPIVMEESTSSMPIRVEILDSEDDDLLAEAELEVTFDDEAQTYCVDSPIGGARIQVTVVESVRGSMFGMVSMKFRMLDVKNVESGILGLGRSDPFVEVQKRASINPVSDDNDGIKWIVAYRTRHVMDNLRPMFDEFRISMENLCYCDTKWPLRLVCYDWQRSGKHRVIGLVDTTLEELMRCVSTNGNADRSSALNITKEGKTKSKGLLVILKADIEDV